MMVQRVRPCLRPDDLFARYGGEEFVILLPRADLEGALTAAERVRAVIAREAFAYEDKSIPVTISIGVASCSHPAPPLQKLIKEADDALYEAKHRGRNRVEHVQAAE